MQKSRAQTNSSDAAAVNVCMLVLYAMANPIARIAAMKIRLNADQKVSLFSILLPFSFSSSLSLSGKTKFTKLHILFVNTDKTKRSEMDLRARLRARRRTHILDISFLYFFVTVIRWVISLFYLYRIVKCKNSPGL